ncbi:MULTISPECIES: M35 family metallo-endopeptidase [unclassified Duganella]|uniref:M35 family metallo-endopeptidase n=1 Tax=unclassified Duganella TaxID=2636909 RepID=UPI0006FB939C|nr:MULTISPECIES: M35 family metallo-endopeptidase [unclassified Duganella]KQV61316.1 peptidase M35 [Duganella sp. Root336D2]KRB92596.1 peptidase M35 [Duganella sp. Root198D2]
MNLKHLGAFALAASFSLGAYAADGLTASISMDKRALGPSDDVMVQVTLTNTSSVPQYVLKWHTPFGEIEESLFEVTRDGAKVPYEGMHVKRAAPTPADYYVIHPGKSHKVTVELSHLYNMSISGDYSIRYLTKSSKLFSSMDPMGKAVDKRQSDTLQSDALAISIEGSLPRGSVAKAPAAPEALAGSLSFSKCTASQQSTVTSAVSAAKNMANDANGYLGANKTGQRYTKWFGTYTSSRYSTVKSHFTAIKDAFDNKPVTVDCGCKQSYYAYVYPNQPYKIYVCKAFWSAPMTGTDSKGGTLVHEMSHFNVTAGTDDHAYGQSAAASLAISNPTQAIDNADSHEYFGENTPALQ